MGWKPLVREEPDEPVKFVGVKFVESMLTSIDDVAEQRNTTRSTVLREAVQLYLEQQQHQEVASSA